jgi:DNA-binding response OmpR family regulator
MNIVVVKACHELRAETVATLSAMGHTVRGVEDAAALDRVLDKASAASPVDLLLLDLDLAGEDGLSLARRMRAARPMIGIVIVSGRTRLDDRLAGYAVGADLYLTQPVAAQELGAVLQALARRMHPTRPQAIPLTLNPATLQLNGRQGARNVSEQECTLLAAFADAAGGRLATAQIAELTGKTPQTFSKYALEVQIVRLRKKLAAVGATAPSIKALRGSGYQICVSLAVSDDRRPSPSR